MVTSAVCWGVWKLRNNMHFQGLPWRGLKQVWHRVVSMLRCWTILVPLKLVERFEDVMVKLEQVAMRPERILAGQVAAVLDASTEDAQGRRGASSFDPP
jgi:hypothetical protein